MSLYGGIKFSKGPAVATVAAQPTQANPAPVQVAPVQDDVAPATDPALSGKPTAGTLPLLCP